jgi:uncharacterized phage protein gp47/JayE
MSFAVPSFEAIRNQYLQAVANQVPTAAIGPDSDHFVRASAIAAVMESYYAHQAWVFRQAFPDLADGDYMEKMALQRGLTRKAAAAATGTVRFAGTVGTTLPLGQVLATAQGVAFATTAAGVVGAGGTVDVAAQAQVAGAAGTQTANTQATVTSPPEGITSAATILAMTGGADIESDESLLGRLLLQMSELAQGGNSVDYESWAVSVAGVDRAYVFPVRRGVGTVDVVPMPTTGLPDTALLASVQAVLDAKRPVGMLPTYGVMALAPTAVPVAVTAVLALSGTTLSAISSAAQSAIAEVFDGLAPGGTLVRNQLISALLSLDGVTDVTLSAPAANVGCSVSSTALEMITLGTVSLT